VNFKECQISAEILFQVHLVIKQLNQIFINNVVENGVAAVLGNGINNYLDANKLIGSNSYIQRSLIFNIFIEEQWQYHSFIISKLLKYCLEHFWVQSLIMNDVLLIERVWNEKEGFDFLDYFFDHLILIK
jgi:hypothetical protein